MLATELAATIVYVSDVTVVYTLRCFASVGQRLSAG